jgi:hypothetical protein
LEEEEQMNKLEGRM